MYEKDGTSANTLVESGLKFTVAEIQNGRFTDLCAVGLGDIFREIA